MKRIIGIALLALGFLWFPDPVVHAQQVPTAGATRFSNEWVASNFGRWTLRASQGSAATGSYTLTFPSGGYTTASGNQSFTPFNTTTRIKVGIGSTQETVTPSAVSGCGVSSVSNCQVTATFTYAHGAGTPVTSGSGGFDEAMNVASQNGGGSVLWDSSSGTTLALVEASTALFPNVNVQSYIGAASPTYFQIEPTALTALSTPTALVATAACGGTTTMCDGTAVGTWTAAAQYGCVFYVDRNGQKSPCSSTANYTSAGSLAINITSPAASTGAVGYGVSIGLSYAAAYQLPTTSANCVLTTIETITPACAIGANSVWPTPTTTTALHPGYVVNTYNPSDVTYNAWGWQPDHHSPICSGLLTDYGPFLATAGGTTTQVQVLGSVELPSACLNQITKTLVVTGKIAMTNGTSETPQVLIQLGLTFTTGTPKTICKMAETGTALTAAANSVSFSCTMTTNAIGSTGTVMPNGWAGFQLQAGSTAGGFMVDTGTAAITSENITGTNTLYVTYIGTSGTSTAAQLLDLHLSMP